MRARTLLVAEDGDLELEDPSGLSPLEGAAGKEYLLNLRQELDAFCKDVRTLLIGAKGDPRNAEIFFCFFGLSDGSFQKKTFQEVADRFGVSRESVRQIVTKQIWPRLARRDPYRDDAQQWLFARIGVARDVGFAPVDLPDEQSGPEHWPLPIKE